MIKFFRHIRQKLLSENKFSKYLFYALGEIVLVVIGILIALQINNWNDAKKEKKELNEYLQKISTNIHQDIEQLTQLRNRRKQVLEVCQKAVQNFHSNTFDPIVNTRASEAFIDFYFTPNQSGYEALKNSSYLGKINGTAIDSLIDNYNATLNFTLTEELSYLAYVERMEVQWTSKHDLSKIMAIGYELGNIRNIDELDPDFQEKLKIVFEDQSYRSVVARTSVQTGFITHSTNLIDTGNKIIEEIERLTHD